MARETAAGMKYLDEGAQDPAAFREFSLMLFNMNPFLYVE